MAKKGKKGKMAKEISKAVSLLGKRGDGVGFSAVDIRRTISKLLKIYGDEGWPFIKENSFQLVMETMLAEQEEKEKQKKSGKEMDKEKDNILDGDSTGTDWDSTGDEWDIPDSRNVIEDGEPSSHFPDLAGALSTDDSRRDIPHANLNTGQTSNPVPVAPPKTVPPTSPRREPCYGRVGEIEGEEDILAEASSAGQSSNIGQVTPAEIVPFPKPRRKPCYGWIKETLGGEEDILAEASSADDGSRDIPRTNLNTGQPSNIGHVAPAEIVPSSRPRRKPCYGWIQETMEGQDDILAEASFVDDGRSDIPFANLNLSPSSDVVQVAPAETVPPRRPSREPCYGWIDETIKEGEGEGGGEDNVTPQESEEKDCTPAPAQAAPPLRKRRSGWDMTPWEWENYKGRKD